MRKYIVFITISLLALVALVLAQADKSKRPSPPAQAQCKFADGKTVTVDYSSPRVSDPKTHQPRKIFGGLVPYGEVWRTGANEATTFVANTNLIVGGKDVPAGSYTIFTVPSPEKWTLVVSKKTGEWGVPYPGEGDDFTRTDMAVSKTPSAVENFTIAFDEAGGKCALRMEWENTRATVDVAQKK